MDQKEYLEMNPLDRLKYDFQQRQFGKSVLETPTFSPIDVQFLLNEKKSIEIKAKAYEEALEKLSVYDCEANERPYLTHYCDGRIQKLAKEVLERFKEE